MGFVWTFTVDINLVCILDFYNYRIENFCSVECILAVVYFVCSLNLPFSRIFCWKIGVTVHVRHTAMDTVHNILSSFFLFYYCLNFKSSGFIIVEKDWKYKITLLIFVNCYIIMSNYFLINFYLEMAFLGIKKKKDKIVVWFSYLSPSFVQSGQINLFAFWVA